MGDLFVGNLDLTILRHDHIKLVAQANIQARTIRIIELQEEIARCENDIIAQKKVVEEATDAKGGGPLLSKGGNKHDVYKGHADMTYAKGEKGGKGGHSLETAPAKSEHTVTHGGKNLATLGGNKKKV